MMALQKMKNVFYMSSAFFSFFLQTHVFSFIEPTEALPFFPFFSPSLSPRNSSAEECTYDILSVVPTDSTCFTQGIEFIDTHTYVQTCGGYGDSKIQLVDTRKNEIIKTLKGEKKYFFEGVTIYNNTYIVLTWREKTILRFDKDFKLLSKYEKYPYEGWGICANEPAKLLYTSDGSNRIHILNADTYEETDFIGVYCFNNKPTKLINELEYLPSSNYIYANIWFDYRIIRIDVKKRKCDKFFNFEGVYRGDGEAFNGIAFIPPINFIKFYKNRSNNDVAAYRQNLLLNNDNNNNNNNLLVVNSNSDMDNYNEDSSENPFYYIVVTNDTDSYNDRDVLLLRGDQRQDRKEEEEKKDDDLYSSPAFFLTGKLWENGYITNVIQNDIYIRKVYINSNVPADANEDHDDNDST